jgi:predicted RecA/RadA family phage recombinase
MATTEKYVPGTKLSVACTQPATPVSGDPVLYGQRPGVAETAERADGTASVSFQGVYRLSVRGETNAGAGSAVAEGDILYYDQPMGAPFLNKDTTGVRFGYAKGAVNSGATATIEVILGY